jgi:hypothetical protein
MVLFDIKNDDNEMIIEENIEDEIDEIINNIINNHILPRIIQLRIMLKNNILRLNIKNILNI